LVGTSGIRPERLAQLKDQHQARLDEAFQTTETSASPPPEQKKSGSSVSDAPPLTGVPLPVLSQMGQDLTQVPPDFTLHPKLKRFLATRQAMTAGTQG